MIDILFENNDFVACVKPVGVCSQSDKASDMVTLLKAQLNWEIYPVHRLDTAVGGTMIFAKNSRTAAALSKLISENTFKKEYLAVVTGVPEDKNAVLEDLLFKDSSKNKTFVVRRVRRGVKKASLEYETLSAVDDCSLVRILLHTGRTHQIRVQFATRQHPLVGDGKYGSKDNRCSVALWSYRIAFNINDEKFCFVSMPDFSVYPWHYFKIEL